MANFINQYLLNVPLGWLGIEVPPDFWLGFVIAALIQCGALLGVVAVGAVVFIWMERKVSARMQDRLGPTRTGGKFGWMQVFADGLKLFTKEDVMPAAADSMLFKLAPYIAFAASFSAYLALPFSDGWVALHLNIAIFFIVAVLGLEVFGTILAGYGSGSKWSLYGGIREAAQVVGYEVPLGICIVVPVMICGSMDLTAIANQQQGLFTNWLIFHDPFTFVVFWVYFACAMASVNRAPFDLAEAESELVAGFLTEYSGMRWSLFFMAEYGSMFLVSGLAAILFFGGWHGPIPIFTQILGWDFAAGNTFWLTGYLAGMAGALNFIIKASLGVTVMIWARWTLPRLRIDQVITMCLKYCTPIAAVMFLGAVLWTAMDAVWDVPRVLSPNDWAPGPQRAEVHEGWSVRTAGAGRPTPSDSATALGAGLPTPPPPPVQPLNNATAEGVAALGAGLPPPPPVQPLNNATAEGVEP